MRIVNLKILVLISGLLHTAGHSQVQQYWWGISLDKFPRIEFMSNKQINIVTPIENSADVSVASKSPSGQTCLINQLYITPPAGLENQYLSMLLTALATGKTLLVQAPAPSSNSMYSTRFLIQ